MSFATPEANRKFSQSHSFSFPLLSDSDRQLALAYGACSDVNDRFPARLTFIVGPTGQIEHLIETRDPAGQAQVVLDLLG